MKYINITNYDIANGTGIRIVLWVSGCSLHCKSCHNQNTWDKNTGKKFTIFTFIKIIRMLKKDYISGITYSGGHPLEPYNIKTITKLSKYIKHKYPNKNQWLYTGLLWEDIKNLEIIKYLDVVVDGKFDINKKDLSLKFRGSSNQRLIDVKSSLKQNKVINLKI